MSADHADNDDYDAVRSFAKRWAYGTLRQAERLGEVLKQAKNRAAGTTARGETWFLEPSVSELLDAAWVEQHLLMVSAHQFEKWATRMLNARGEIRSAEDEHMRLLRNSLEHLDEAVLDGGYAMPGPKGNWSLRSLPTGRLPLGIELGADATMIFDLVDVERIEKNCADLAAEIFEEEVDIDAMIDSHRDMERGI